MNTTSYLETAMWTGPEHPGTFSQSDGGVCPNPLVQGLGMADATATERGRRSLWAQDLCVGSFSCFPGFLLKAILQIPLILSKSFSVTIRAIRG
jgi:hypothetical protein